MSFQEALYFLRRIPRAFTSIGALLPTSRFAAQAMASEVARRREARAILEVGPGTGAITAAIVAAMRPDDRLVLVELDPDFVAYLHQRFEREPAFRRVRDQVTILHQDVTQLDRSQRFDCIVSAIPFTNLPPDLVERILETYRAILRPGGVLTYIEYAYLRSLKRHLLRGQAREQMARSAHVFDEALERHEFRRDMVWRNVPPAWIHHLRFAQPQPDDALELEPLDHTRRIAITRTMGLSTEAIPWLLALVAAALLRPLRAQLGLLALAIAAFFRDPQRSVVADPNAIYAACDGRVLSVERVCDARFGDGEWLRIAVFLSLFDVHINRSPVAGRVEQVIEEDGGFAAANRMEAEHNYARYTVIQGVDGRCVVAQRAGLVARRIVSWVKPGALVAQGERFGLIRFGSRTDVYVPAGAVSPCVAPGDRVSGGTTVIARYSDGGAR